MKNTDTQSTQNTVKENSIFVSSWGYEQTNVDFYQVLKVTGKSVLLAKIEKKQVNIDEGGNGMSGHVVPSIDEVIKTEPSFRRVLKIWSDGSASIRINSCARAYAWNGKPQRNSWYA